MREKNQTQLHFVGIGGIGMSGIAEVFLNQGYRVSGSDLNESDSTRRLKSLGAQIAIGHKAENIRGAHVVVMSSAVRANNPEIVEARKQRTPVIPRAEMLGELMRGKIGIAVAGTHGKTTTTSMLSTVLTVAGLDPTLVIGGKVDSLGGNAKLGQGAYVVAEADESDGSFLHLPATYGIVTNIDNDHLDHFGNLETIEKAFIDFVAKLPFYGMVAVCADDRGVKRVLEKLSKPFVTYGTEGDLDYVASDIEVHGLGTIFNVYQKGPNGPQKLGPVRLNVPGRHNVLNAMASVAIATQLGLNFDVISMALGAFHGVKRRFEIRYKDLVRKQVVVDDYGHHPTEIAAALAAARGYWQGRVIAVFQPHRYSRTLHCHEGFLSAFKDADVVFVTDIYAAGEDPIEGVTAQALVEAIKQASPAGKRIEYAGDLDLARGAVLNETSEGDLVICLGAGSITKLPELVAQRLQEIALSE